ncbi:MAG TPA: hypothetical protein VGI45_22695 [Terracidiphilus sp.]|jgi:hypothetical protein
MAPRWTGPLPSETYDPAEEQEEWEREYGHLSEPDTVQKNASDSGEATR